MAVVMCVNLEFAGILRQIHKDAMYLSVSSARETAGFRRDTKGASQKVELGDLPQPEIRILNICYQNFFPI